MTNEEFQKRLDKQNLGETVTKRFNEFLAGDVKDICSIFAPLDEKTIEPEDFMFIQTLLSDTLNEISLLECGADLIPQKRLILIRMMYVFRLAEKSSEVILSRMLHDMRGEYDYAGLGLLFDELFGFDLPFDVYFSLAEMIFNDHYPELNLNDRTESPLYEFFYEQLNRYLKDLIHESEEGERLMKVKAEEENDVDKEIPLSLENLHILYTQEEEELPIQKIDVQKRFLQICAVLMAMSNAAENLFAEYAKELRQQESYYELTSVLNALSAIPDGTYSDYLAFCSVLMGGEKKE